VSVVLGVESKRYFYRVKGSEPVPYVTTPFHCNCMAFLNQVRRDGRTELPSLAGAREPLSD
jgi:hypothetical protein